MSELVNRINSLRQRVAELQEEVASERARYVDEVDHSDEMVYILQNLRNTVDARFQADIDHILRSNAIRRQSDEVLPALSYSNDD